MTQKEYADQLIQIQRYMNNVESNMCVIEAITGLKIAGGECPGYCEECIRNTIMKGKQMVRFELAMAQDSIDNCVIAINDYLSTYGTLPDCEARPLRETVETVRNLGIDFVYDIWKLGCHLLYYKELYKEGQDSPESGYWINDDQEGKYICSLCGESFWRGHTRLDQFCYCPKCGKRMKGERMPSGN